MFYFIFFFFSSRRRHTRCGRDWSSDVCSSDLIWSTYAETLGSSDETKTSYITFPLVACEKASIENITNAPVKNALILILCKLKKRMIRSEERRVGKECRYKRSTEQ